MHSTHCARVFDVATTGFAADVSVDVFIVVIVILAVQAIRQFPNVDAIVDAFVIIIVVIIIFFCACCTRYDCIGARLVDANRRSCICTAIRSVSSPLIAQ
jgi:chromate transport protein ChrA